MRLLTVPEVASLLGVSNDLVRRYLNSGALPGTNLGGRRGWRIREEDIDPFLVRLESDRRERMQDKKDEEEKTP